MNIVLGSSVSGIAGGGTAAYIRNLGDNLIERGHWVSAVSRLKSDLRAALNYSTTERFDGLSDSVIKFGGWECKIVRPSGIVALALPHLDHLVWRAQTQKLSTLLFTSAYREGIDKLIPHDTEVIHYTGAGAELIGFVFAEIARRREAAFTVTPFVHPNQWADSPIDIRLYNLADAVFVCTDLEGAHLTKLGVAKHKITISPMAPSGLRPGCGDRFRKFYGIESRLIVLFLGRKQRYKGFHLLCESMRKVVERYPDVTLVAAGTDDEPPFPELPKANFIDLGELTASPEHSQTKADALAACDIFCMPSAAEAFGLVYAEAWHFGKPVIGGPAPALRELIDEGYDGFIVRQEKKQLIATLERLILDESLRKRLGEAGQIKQRTRFTWDAVIDHHISLWSSINERKLQ